MENSGKSVLLFLVVCAGVLQECACHEDSYRNTGVGSSNSCPEYTLRVPYQCSGSERSCDYTVKWEDARRNVNVTLSARIGSQGGWSAIGFTASRGIPELSFILCSNNGNSSSVQLTHSVNHSLVSLQNPRGLHLIEAHYQDKVLTCSFSLSKDFASFGEPLDSRVWYVGVASGTHASNSSFASRISYSECACNVTSCLDCCHSNNNLRRLLMKLHGVVMMIVFMVLAPFAAMVARYYKPVLPDSWFKVHMVTMVVSVTGILAGLGLILGHTAGKLTVGVHQYIGLLCISLAVFQPAYGFLRPPLGNTTRRKVFNVVHRIGAASILGLGMFNLYSGVLKLHNMVVGPLVGILLLHLVVSLATAFILEFLFRSASFSGHVGYQKVKKIVDDNSSSEEEVFVKEDGMKTTHHSSIHQKDEPYTYARELTILTTYVFLTFSLSGLASGMVYYN